MTQNTTQSNIPLSSHAEEEDKNPYLSIDSEEQQQEEEQESKEESNTQSVDLLTKRLQQFSANAPKSKEQFYQSSFEIFSALNDCVKGNDSSEFKDSKKMEISRIVSDYVDLVHDYEDISMRTSIWDITYALYFSREETSIATRLNEWLEVNKHLSKHIDDLVYDEGDNDYTWIWENSRRNLLRGNYIEAVEALAAGLHTLSENELHAVEIIIRLINKFQDIQQYNNDVTVYAGEWTSLHEECGYELNRFIESCDEEFKEIDEEIKMIFAILTGDEEAIFISGQYFERMIGSLIFTRPSTTMSGLYHVAQRAVYSDSEVDICAYIAMGCFDDAFEACNDIWLQTHLGHALIAVGAKSTDIVINGTTSTSPDQEVVIDPVYYCIDQYAAMIAEESNMWKEAVVYISACVENREIWIKKLLNESVLQSKDMDLLKTVLDIATKENISNVQKYIHRVIGKRYEHKKDIKNATIEYGKAQDLESLDRFAHVEFSHYLKSGKLGPVVTDMNELKACPHYAILILFYEFKAHLAKKEWKKASNILLELLEREHLPTKFEMVLLIDNIAILEDSKQHYSQNDMIKLIDLLKIINKDTANEEFLGKYYKLIHHKDLPPTVVYAKLRERIAYKAAIAASDQ